MKWSPQQEAIFGWFRGEHPAQNLVARARAGTGKTTTIMAAVLESAEAKAGGSVLLAAFNKTIADELTARLERTQAPGNIEAKTLHGAGFAIVRRFWRGVTVDATRGKRLAREALGDQAPDEIVAFVSRLADKAKEIVPLGGDDPSSALTDLAYRFDCVPDEEWTADGFGLQVVVDGARRALRAAMDRDDPRKPSIDFGDMVFLPIANDWLRGRYDLVVIDEAQDMSPAQLLLAQGLVRPGGRVAVVGDDRQAIYAFRGADAGSVDRLKYALSASELGLTVTYRCGKRIVAEAAALVPDYSAAEEAHDGEVGTATRQQMLEGAQAGDFVLSRKNAPLAVACLAFLRAGKRAKVRGREVGAALIAVVKKLKARSIPELIVKIGRWRDKEIARARKGTNEAVAEEKQQEVEDVAETLVALSEGLTGPAELATRIESLFDDAPERGGTIVLSSVHKAKGLEADTVWLLAASFVLRGKRVDQREEDNIRYVAITRAKQRLVWVKEEVAA